MKLLRVGQKGQEKPAALDKDGKIRDISSHISDLNPDHLNFETISNLQNADLSSLPELSSSERIGSCITKPGKFIGIGLNFSDHAAEAGLPAQPRGHDNEFDAWMYMPCTCPAACIACARPRQQAEAEPAASTHHAAGLQPSPAPPPRRRARRRSESRVRKGLPRLWSPIPGRLGPPATGGDGAGAVPDQYES